MDRIVIKPINFTPKSTVKKLNSQAFSSAKTS